MNTQTTPDEQAGTAVLDHHWQRMPLVYCESAWGPDADRHAKLLIHLAVEGSTLNAYSQRACDTASDQLDYDLRRRLISANRIELMCHRTPAGQHYIDIPERVIICAAGISRDHD
jgi:hypothetical protein